MSQETNPTHQGPVVLLANPSSSFIDGECHTVAGDLNAKQL